jgi:hypothetical protein
MLVEDTSRNKCFSQFRISHVLRFISICDVAGPGLIDMPPQNLSEVAEENQNPIQDSRNRAKIRTEHIPDTSYS